MTQEAADGSQSESTGAGVEEKIRALEEIARRLEPAAGQRRDWADAVGAYAEAFLNGLPDARTYVSDQGCSARLDTVFREEPLALGELLSNLRDSVDTAGINPASGGHLGYIPGGGVYPSALGDFLADVANRYSGVAFASPGAVRLEQALIDWMARLVGFPPGAGGDLTSGGSIANLTGIVTAREAMKIRARDIPIAAIYHTGQVHHCVDKALRVAGLAECPRRVVSMDRNHRMQAPALASMLQADRAAGLNPWLVVASAGTTDTGAVDPLPEIAETARAAGAWLHLDAAYGGFFRLCEEGREVLQGMELADSIVMDPHKGLFLPYGSGAVLVRDVHQLAGAHSYQADYMQDARADGAGYSPADLSAELSRPFRGLRLWLPLKLFGLQPFRAALAEKIWLARYFHQRLAALPRFEVGPRPDLSVVTYRYLPRTGDADAFNRRLLQGVLEDGRVFISSTRIAGRFTLRLAVLHFRTHRDTIDYLLDLLPRLAEKLEDG
jgi:glutamate/tyrosine decarboxylase-like PLP-dependent enzyme